MSELIDRVDYKSFDVLDDLPKELFYYACDRYGKRYMPPSCMHYKEVVPVLETPRDKLQSPGVYIRHRYLDSHLQSKWKNIHKKTFKLTDYADG